MKVSQNFTIDDVDWNNLVLRLTLAAIKFTNKNENFVVSGVGNSIEDYVRESIVILFDNFDKYNPRTQDECYAIAKKIMENDFIDSVRSSSHKTTDNLGESEDGINYLYELPSKTNGFEDLEKDILAEQYYRFANNEEALKYVIDSVVYCGELETRNIAALLNTSSEEVNNRKRRLRYNRDKKTNKS